LLHAIIERKQTMKSIFLLLVIVISVNLSAHKKYSDDFEISMFAATVNIGRQQVIYNNNFELLNSIQFRYSRYKLGYRLTGEYQRQVHHYPFHDNNGSGIKSNSFRLSAGIQYSFSDQLSWLYTFADLGFRKLGGTGYYSGKSAVALPVALEMIRKSAGAELQTGIGVKLKLSRHCRFFAETGLNVLYLKNKYIWIYDTHGWPVPDEAISSATGLFGRLGFSVAF
jgi:hypothetical protein